MVGASAGGAPVPALGVTSMRVRASEGATTSPDALSPGGPLMTAVLSRSSFAVRSPSAPLPSGGHLGTFDIQSPKTVCGSVVYTRLQRKNPRLLPSLVRFAQVPKTLLGLQSGHESLNGLQGGVRLIPLRRVFAFGQCEHLHRTTNLPLDRFHLRHGSVLVVHA